MFWGLLLSKGMLFTEVLSYCLPYGCCCTEKVFVYLFKGYFHCVCIILLKKTYLLKGCSDLIFFFSVELWGQKYTFTHTFYLLKGRCLLTCFSPWSYLGERVHIYRHFLFTERLLFTDMFSLWGYLGKSTHLYTLFVYWKPVTCIFFSMEFAKAKGYNDVGIHEVYLSWYMYTFFLFFLQEGKRYRDPLHTRTHASMSTRIYLVISLNQSFLWICFFCSCCEAGSCCMKYFICSHFISFDLLASFFVHFDLTLLFHIDCHTFRSKLLLPFICLQ